MNNFLCVECGNHLAPNATACACGWRKMQAMPGPHVDYRCAHRIDKQRCEAAGTISRSTTAKGAWYCSKHWYAH